MHGFSSNGQEDTNLSFLLWFVYFFIMRVVLKSSSKSVDMGKLLNCESSSHVQSCHIFPPCCPLAQTMCPLVFESILIHMHCHACFNFAAFVELKILCQSKTLLKQLLCQINNSTVFGRVCLQQTNSQGFRKDDIQVFASILYLPGRFPHNGRMQLCRLACQGTGHVLSVTCSAFSMS